MMNRYKWSKLKLVRESAVDKRIGGEGMRNKTGLRDRKG